MSEAVNNFICRSEDVAAYLDGELDEPARSGFEGHVKECSACAARLHEQRRLLCALDFALSDDPALALPKNFAQIVAANAQSDMRGMRQRSEHRRALRLCLALAALSFALLGGASASRAVLAPLGQSARAVASVLGFAWHALYGAGAGLAVISRSVGWHLLFEHLSLGLPAFLLLAVAAAVLPRQIVRYHRTRIIE
jgi:anti-sigma factor RsiW